MPLRVTFISQSAGWWQMLSVFSNACVMHSDVMWMFVFVCVLWFTLSAQHQVYHTHTRALPAVVAGGGTFRLKCGCMCVFSFFVLLMLFFTLSPSKPSLDVYYLNPAMVVTLLLLYRLWKTPTHIKFFENLANNTVLMITWYSFWKNACCWISYNNLLNLWIGDISQKRKGWQ